MARPSWEIERVQALTILVAQGLSASKIGARLGCSRNAVVNQCTRRGLTLRGTPGPAPGTRQGPPEHRPVKRTSFNPADGGVILKPRPPRPEIIADPTATLSELDKHRCHWPIGDPTSPTFGYCGRPSDGRYCEAHARVGVSPHDLLSRARMDQDFEKLAKWVSR